MLRTAAAAAIAVALSTAPAAAYSVACWGEASAGKTITQTRVSDDIDGPITLSADGLQGGIGIGCDYGIGSAVIGALARYEIMDVSGVVSDASYGADAMWTLALRAGVKINPSTLVYGLAGFSGVELSYPGLDIDPTGLTYGAGLEFDVAHENLAAFVEWSHTSFSQAKEGGANIRPDSDTFRVGVRVKFDLLK